ncbi:MAG TPA: DUF4446 family protein [Candidatus Limnocylindrales bacterium]
MDLDAIVRDNLGSIVAGLAIATLLLLILAIVEARRIGRLRSRLAALTRGSDERSLEAILEAHLTRVHEVVRDVDAVEARTAILERDLKLAFSRVGLVRFNPFEDTGGNQSFALALLDVHGDGFVLSSLHARGGTRVYAKAVTGGKAEAALSDEEAQALQIATAPPARAAG